MAYTKEIKRTFPTCFMFVIDQSGSMDEQMDDGSIKSHFVADVLNQTLAETIVRCTKADGVRDYFNIGVIGYGGEHVSSAFAGPLSGGILHPISEIESSPLRIEEREMTVDTGDDVLDRQIVKFPVWIDPKNDGGTPMREAMSVIGETVAQWCDDNSSSYPPTVVYVTDGQSTDGDPEEVAAAIRDVTTNDGNVLLFNLHVDNGSGEEVLFPSVQQVPRPPDPGGREHGVLGDQ